MPEVWEQAEQEYPALAGKGILYKRTPRQDSALLEAWPPQETGTKQQPRPKEFPVDKYGVEVYSPKVRPIDIAGDVVSHFMRGSDPTIKQIYDQFASSLTPQQEDRLRSQYKWSGQHEKEKRGYKDWREQAGLPAYFRGLPFQQWGPETRSWYTPQQMQMFDKMMKYLRTKPTDQP
jgi:hypothetical protein